MDMTSENTFSEKFYRYKSLIKSVFIELEYYS